MNTETGKWDIRCPQAMCNMFSERRGYYYKVNNEQAQKILNILSKAYKISPPKVKRIPSGTGNNAMYHSPDTVLLYARNHLKSVWHEFYHHLDFCTDGKYDSSDHRGGFDSNGWKFADRMWGKFRNKPAKEK